MSLRHVSAFENDADAHTHFSHKKEMFLVTETRKDQIMYNTHVRLFIVVGSYILGLGIVLVGFVR